MRARVAELSVIAGLATIITAGIAAPVVRAPSERVFGMPIVGRHHDPFTVMEQFRGPVAAGVYLQPMTDIPGALLARAAGPVAAYNLLVLLSFPLSALAAYLLARHLTISGAGAALAALAFAFSPFHLAQAAYHPHIAQTQWLPLYLLALWRCLDTASPSRVALLAGATAAVTLSNFYGGLIAAVITPVAALSYWLATERRSTAGLAVTAGTLTILAAGGMLYGLHAAAPVITDRAVFSFPRADLFRYSAKWWGYLVPPVGHPLLGATASRIWDGVPVGDGLLEQQVSLGWGILALGLIAGTRWLVRGDRARTFPALAYVPALALIAFAALLCSLSPERMIGHFNFVRPSALLYGMLPMFRSYARFGVLVQLMAALLAGIGLDCLRRRAARHAQVACAGLVAVCAFEYAVAPHSLWRDVLPTAAHRWIMRQPAGVRALDCARLDQESRSVEWLTGNRVRLLPSAAGDCTEPHLPAKLAATGFTHLVVRADSASWVRFSAMDGLRLAASFPDGQVLAVVAEPPPIYIAERLGFSPREHHAGASWQWMGADAAWTIVNPASHPVVATLELEVSAFLRDRRLELLLDGRTVQTLTIEPRRGTHPVGPLTVSPGHHALVFRAVEAPTIAADVINNGDRRALSFALGMWNWSLREERP